MKLFNSAINGLFDLLFWPFSALPPIWVLTIVSVASGVLMLWIFGRISDQDSIRTIRDRIRGNLIAVRLFGDDIGLLFRLQGRLLWDNVVFLKYALLPLLVMFIPVLLIIVQLNLRFAAEPLVPGQSTLLKVTTREAGTIASGVTLEAPEGIVVETPGVRVSSQREVSWRIRTDREGEFDLRLLAGGDEVVKQLRVGGGWGAVSTLRTGKSFFEKLLYPGEAPIAGSPIQSIEVVHEPLPLELFGFPMNWLFFFFVVSILAGFAFRRALGVEI